MRVLEFYSCLVFFALTWNIYSSASINDKLVVNKVDRTIDISSQLAKVGLDIALENTGSEPATSFLVAVDSMLASHLAYASASVSIHC